MVRLLVFDPGPHTGVAVLHDGILMHAVTIDTVDGEAAQYHAIKAWFQDLFADRADSIILCETFHSRAPGIGVSQAGMITMHLCGWIYGLALTYNFPFHWVEPSVKRAYEDEAKKMYHDSQHSQDAVAHALAWLAKQQRKAN